MKNYIEKYFLDEVFKYFDKKTTKVVMYGSFNLEDKGDFDVAVICQDYNEYQKEKIHAILKELHKKFSLRVDDDVPYFNKSLFNFKECEYLLKHPPFKFENGRVVIEPFYGNKDYFISKEARYRLLVNLLTADVRVLHGNIRKERKLMYELLVGIVLSSQNNKPLSLHQLVQYLCVDPYTYYSYKRYLGYNPLTDAKFLMKNVKSTIKELVKNKSLLRTGKKYVLTGNFLEVINNLDYGHYML